MKNFGIFAFDFYWLTRPLQWKHTGGQYENPHICFGGENTNRWSFEMTKMIFITIIYALNLQIYRNHSKKKNNNNNNNWLFEAYGIIHFKENFSKGFKLLAY